MIPLLIFVALLIFVLAEAFLKPSAMKYFSILISTLLGIFIAFSYFEILAAQLIKNGLIVNMAHMASLLLIFILSTLALSAVASIISKKDLNLPMWLKRAVSMSSSVLLCYLVTGMICVAFSMAPIGGKWLYPRVVAATQLRDGEIQSSSNLLKADDAITGLFSWVSSGAFSSGKNFRMYHENFVDDCYINKFHFGEDIGLIAGREALNVAGKTYYGPANKLIQTTKNERVDKSGEKNLHIIALRLNTRSSEKGGAAYNNMINFTTGQLRIICSKGSDGKTETVYPIGFLNQSGKMQQLGPVEIFDVRSTKVQGDNPLIKAVFDLPQGCKPAALAFKQNFIMELPRIEETED
ncbi:hypothetical protein SMSP2_02705 [Limihaloglobus sulfuriphilus]|uniref:CvpA family protein n=1 Tax=Limihaloglobus sulfuriphilus TaxID=1851148 RepID=A0A1Q2MJ09_9BACT|nr:hypothetical protein [Limihaloglobus sulfuriphilus]AQQ72322.1 hypothetical protein SMSP2_02705 [Limihaloglobus sulfuriphilus]